MSQTPSPSKETTVLKTFLSKQLSIVDIEEVPGIATANAKRLLKKGITSPQQLAGYYMTLNCDEAKFKAFLENEVELKWKYADAVVEAFKEKKRGVVQSPGEMVADGTFRGRPDDTSAVEFFVNFAIRIDALQAGMIPGIGATAAKKLRSAGINTPCELVGRFLLGSDDIKSRDVAAFEKWLGDICAGCAASFTRHKTVQLMESKVLNFCEPDKVKTPASREPGMPAISETRDTSAKANLGGRMDAAAPRPASSALALIAAVLVTLLAVYLATRRDAVPLHSTLPR